MALEVAVANLEVARPPSQGQTLDFHVLNPLGDPLELQWVPAPSKALKPNVSLCFSRLFDKDLDVSRVWRPLEGALGASVAQLEVARPPRKR